MASRMELHNKLLGIVPNVYFQAPETVKMTYPCIRYNLNSTRSQHADNLAYITKKSYTLTLIDINPDNEYVDEIIRTFNVDLDRAYTSNNLNHYVFNLYY